MKSDGRGLHAWFSFTDFLTILGPFLFQMKFRIGLSKPKPLKPPLLSPLEIEARVTLAFSVDLDRTDVVTVVCFSLHGHGFCLYLGPPVSSF